MFCFRSRVKLFGDELGIGIQILALVSHRTGTSL